jgi:PAS domain S-box-containing protein
MASHPKARARDSAIAEELRPILELPVVGVVLWDASGRILDANDRFLEITGYTREDLAQGLDWRRLTPSEWHPTDELVISEVGQSGAAIHLEKEYIHKHGGRVFVQYHSVAVEGAEGLVLSLVVDITEQKRAQAERDALLERAEAAVRSRDEILAIVSHDLRNPLSTISMVVALLEHPMPAERHAAQLDVVRRAVQRMGRLIQDLLDVNQIGSGQLSIAPEAVSAAALIEEARAGLDLHASQHGQRLEWSCAEPDFIVRADRTRVAQVLNNLVGNALKFTPPGGEVSVEVAREGDEARFCVRDTGPGIKGEDLPHIFDRFWQAEGRKRKGGVGLGLAISKGIVTAHGGRIWAASEPGNGAMFCFTLPLATNRE